MIEIKKLFLRLHLRVQIKIVIIILSIFSTLYILFLYYSLLKHIISNLKLEAQQYFLMCGKDNVTYSSNFQNFFIMEYEEIIKFIGNFVSRFLQNLNTTNNIYFGNDKNDSIVYLNNNISPLSDTNNTTKIFYKIIADSPGLADDYNIEISKAFEYSYLSLITLFNYSRLFKIPFLSTEIINDFVFFFYGKLFNIIFSINFNKLNETEHESNNVVHYFTHLQNNYTNNFENILDEVINDKINFYDILYPDYLINLFNDYKKLKNEGNTDKIEKFKKENSLSFPYLIFGNETFIQFDSNYITKNNINLTNLISHNTITKNFTDIISFKMLKYFHLISIPIYHENQTLVNVYPCYIFKLKQLALSNNDLINDDDYLKEIFEKIEKGKSSITDCILGYDENKIDDEFLKFVPNNSNNSGIYSLEYLEKLSYFSNNNNELGFLKTTYPNFNTIYDFGTHYFSCDNIDFYIIFNKKSIETKLESFNEFYDNMLYLVILIIFYIGLFNAIILIFISSYYADQITRPFEDLQESVRNSNINDDKVFHYEYDESINELFQNTGQLLNGQLIVKNDYIKNGNENNKGTQYGKNKHESNSSHKKRNLMKNTNIMVDNTYLEENANANTIAINSKEFIKINKRHATLAKFNENFINQTKKVKNAFSAFCNSTKNIFQFDSDTESSANVNEMEKEKIKIQKKKKTTSCFKNNFYNNLLKIINYLHDKKYHKKDKKTKLPIYETRNIYKKWYNENKQSNKNFLITNDEFKELFENII